MKYPRRFRIRKLEGSRYPWKVADREWPSLIWHCRSLAAALVAIDIRLKDERRAGR